MGGEAEKFGQPRRGRRREEMQKGLLQLLKILAEDTSVPWFATTARAELSMLTFRLCLVRAIINRKAADIQLVQLDSAVRNFFLTKFILFFLSNLGLIATWD